MARTIRLALIGSGRWGSVIKKTLLAMPTCELIYEVTHNWRMLLEKNDIDAVIVATPANTHANIAIPFIERSIPIFIEKPLATSLADAKRIASAAQKYKVPICVGHIHLYNPAYQKTKKLIKKIGPLRLLIGEGTNNGPYRDDVSALWNWAPHDISMMLDITGIMPTSVQAWGVATLRPRTTFYDRAEIKLTFPHSVIGLISSSCLFPEKRKRLTIIGEKSTIVYDDVAEKKVIFYEGMGPALIKNRQGIRVEQKVPTISFPSYENSLPLTLELQAFIEMVQTNKKSKTDIAEGLAVIRVLDAAEKSIRTGGKKVNV